MRTIQRPGKVYIGAIVPESLADDFAALAKASERSVSAEIRLALRRRLGEEDGAGWAEANAARTKRNNE